MRARSSKRSLAFAVAVLTAMSLAVPLVGTAVANHGNCILDVEPENATNNVGTTHTITAQVQSPNGGQCDAGPAGPPGAGQSPTVINIDFEVVGPNDPNNDGNTPTTPDLTCNITVTENDNPNDDRCNVFLTGNEPGDNIIIGWIDHDNNNATVEADLEEGVNAAADPGAIAEPDITDVVRKVFQVAPQQARNIRCFPEDAFNRTGTEHTITCQVTDAQGNNVPGAQVTAREIGPAEFTDTGTNNSTQVTDATGRVFFTIFTVPGEEGTSAVTASLPTNPGVTDECERGAGQPAGAPAGNCEDAVTKVWTDQPIPPEQGFPIDVTLEASKRIKRFGKVFELGGSVSPEDELTPARCYAGVTVILQRAVVGTDQFVEVERTVTDDDGLFAFSRTADKSALYVAVVEQQADEAGQPFCAADASRPADVLVRKAVILKISDINIRRGQRVAFRVRVLPCAGHRGDPVQLHRAIDGVLAKVASKKTNRRCRAVFRRRVFSDSAWQAISPKRDADHLAGKSRPKAVLVRGRG